MKNSFGKDFDLKSFLRKMQKILAKKVDLEKGIVK